MKKLRAYQARDCLAIKKHYESGGYDAAVIYATGSGKTVLAQAIACVCNFTHAIFAAPSTTIQESFRAEVGVFEEITVPTEILRSNSKTKDFIKYLQTPSPGKYYAVTHALLNKSDNIIASIVKRYDEPFKGMLLVIDESHHAGEDQSLTKFIRNWISGGGKVLYLTATPVRTGGEKSIIDIEDVKERVTRKITEQMADGFSPATIDFDLVAVDSPVYDFDAVKTEKIFGAPMDVEKLMESIVQELSSDSGKTIIRFKNLGSESKNFDMISKAKQILEDNGYRVHAATDQTNLKELPEVLRKERGIGGYSDSSVDVIIGIQAVTEGLDWPICSQIFFVGIPASMLLIEQGLGRTMRNKFEIIGYPEGWKNLSRIVMFTGNVNRIEKKHKDIVTRVVCELGCLDRFSKVLASAKDVYFNNKFDLDTNEKIQEGIRHPINEDALPDASILAVEIQEDFYSRILAIKKLSFYQVADLSDYYLKLERYKEFKCSRKDVLDALIIQRPETPDELNENIERNIEAGIDPKQAAQKAWEDLRKAAEELDAPVPDGRGSIYGKLQSIKVTKEYIEEHVRLLDEHERILDKKLGKSYEEVFG